MSENKTRTLIIIRGNSGSGKSTLAKKVREELLKQENIEKVALIEQDYLRRTILKEKDRIDNTAVLDLLEQTVVSTLNNGFITIIEGILSKKKYSDILEKLIDFSTETYAFYLNIPIEETLRRHTTKSNSDEFGEEEMRKWFLENDYLGLENEATIDEKSGLQESIDLIVGNVLE